MPLLRTQAPTLWRAELQCGFNAEQIMAMPARVRRHWTTRDVRSLLDESRHWPRYELIDGELIVTPAPGSLHQIAIGELLVLLREYCLRERIGLVVVSPADLELVPGTVVQPDVFVVPNRHLAKDDELLEWKDIKSLVLAVEVISPSSAQVDRVQKRDFFLSADVDEYWVVDLDLPMIEQWTKNLHTPAVARNELSWHPSGASRPFVLDVPEFVRRCRAMLRRV